MIWPAHLPVRSVRFARPTNQLDAIVAFYRDAIGLPEIGRFEDHDGYTGVMLGLPGEGYHLEFTSHVDGVSGEAPTRDNLLVFYIDDQAALERLIERMRSYGHTPVPPENPYWEKGGVAYEDPDGWGVIFMNMVEHRRLLD
ncbi:VOC family protein [Phototrophicus methaneseepsis]|uniref:VOC family protein n=1 Tax=Phototrophicus methaneseepsis TaxID=2710758 RepID=A0A7S8E7W4_9CHLR|nr:VOC family protein [Phototrophicus methaneseepsis]QPC81979.1 VOC family protein [Phototrophicus methaneseepsis]